MSYYYMCSSDTVKRAQKETSRLSRHDTPKEDNEKGQEEGIRARTCPTNVGSTSSNRVNLDLPHNIITLLSIP